MREKFTCQRIRASISAEANDQEIVDGDCGGSQKNRHHFRGISRDAANLKHGRVEVMVKRGRRRIRRTENREVVGIFEHLQADQGIHTLVEKITIGNGMQLPQTHHRRHDHDRGQKQSFQDGIRLILFQAIRLFPESQACGQCRTQPQPKSGRQMAAKQRILPKPGQNHSED
jgi:hypothetical protein